LLRLEKNKGADPIEVRGRETNFGKHKKRDKGFRIGTAGRSGKSDGQPTQRGEAIGLVLEVTQDPNLGTSGKEGGGAHQPEQGGESAKSIRTEEKQASIKLTPVERKN